MDDLEQQLNITVSAFNSFDWLLLTVVAISMLMGIVRGFGREALALIGWLAAFVIANAVALPLADALTTVSDQASLRYLLGWGLAFVGVLAIFSAVASLLGKQLRQPGFNLGNRILGGAFGVARGVVVMMALSLLMREVLPDSEEDWLNNAQSHDLIETVTGWFTDTLEQAPVIEAINPDASSGKML